MRKNFPDSNIKLIVKKEVFELAENCPYVDTVIKFDLKMSKLLRVFQQYYRIYKIGKQYFWNEEIDLAIIPRWDGDDYYSTFIAYLSGAKRVIGYDQKNGTENLLTDRLEKKIIQHEVKQNLDIIRYLGGKINDDNTEVWIKNDRDTFPNKTETVIERKDRGIIISLAPGASKKKKRWNTEYYISLINKISKTYGDNATFLLLGSEDEKNLGSQIKSGVNNSNLINLIGDTTLHQVSNVIMNSNLFIGNDTGLMHIAAALDVPVVSIFCHPKNGKNSVHNSPLRFGPYTEKKIILQPSNTISPCVDTCLSQSAHCINKIDVDEVLTAVINFLSKYEKYRK